MSSGTNQVISKSQTETKLSTWLRKPELKDRIHEALGKAYDPEFFMEQILIALSDPKLKQLTPESLFRSVHQCASMALLPTHKHVALIPRGRECTVMVQWQGHKALMMRTPGLLDIKHAFVFEEDQFEFDGMNQEVMAHQYDPFDDSRIVTPDLITAAGKAGAGTGRFRGGYLRFIYRDNRPDRYHFVSAYSVFQARSCAQATNVWDKWTQEQTIKTLYRNAFARQVVEIDPLAASRLQAVDSHEDDELQNDPAAMAAPAAIEQAPPVPPAAPQSRGDMAEVMLAFDDAPAPADPAPPAIDQQKEPESPKRKRKSKPRKAAPKQTPAEAPAPTEAETVLDNIRKSLEAAPDADSLQAVWEDVQLSHDSGEIDDATKEEARRICDTLHASFTM